MVISHSFYMQLAVNEAYKHQLLTYPNPAVGAVVLSGCGKILSIQAHKEAGKPHAEVLALKEAYKNLTGDKYIQNLTSSNDIHSYLIKNHNGCFEECEIYTTLEPCSHTGRTPSCANLIKELNLKKVYIGSKDFNKTASGGKEILEKNGIEVEYGIYKERCDNLLYPFEKFIEGRFVFFKWATRLNGTTNDGIISSKVSREFVHALRDKIDLLVIGGNSVRIDRPTLDARLVGGKAPDVLIYSKQKDFDKSIPLFNVKNRKVFIEDGFDILKNYKFVMIEGGAKMFEATMDICDYYLGFIAPVFKKSSGIFNVDANFEILHQRKIGDDILAYMRKTDG